MLYINFLVFVALFSSSSSCTWSVVPAVGVAVAAIMIIIRISTQSRHSTVRGSSIVDTIIIFIIPTCLWGRKRTIGSSLRVVVISVPQQRSSRMGERMKPRHYYVVNN